LAKPPEHTFGSRLEAPVLYATKAREYDRRIVDRVDVVAVASPSAVRAVGKVDLPFASIGRSTSAALQALGLSPWAEATTPGFDALAHAIVARAQPS
jgi:uroporphyrinogen-III synthase